MIETETAGRFRLTGNVFEDWPLAIGSRETLAGKIPANTLAALFLEMLPIGLGRCMGMNEVLPPDDLLGCVGAAGWPDFRGEGPTGG